MPWCAANGCHNRTENNKEVSFHKIPKEPALRKAWYVAIGRIELPESGNVCSAHFTSDCYEDNVKLQLCPELFPNRRSTKRRLKPNAIPSILYLYILFLFLYFYILLTIYFIFLFDRCPFHRFDYLTCDSVITFKDSCTHHFLLQTEPEFG